MKTEEPIEDLTKTINRKPVGKLQKPGKLAVPSTGLRKPSALSQAKSTSQLKTLKRPMSFKKDGCKGDSDE